LKRRLVKNAIANLCRGGTAAVIALVLPAILVRHMTATNYAVWVLVLQVVAYIGYLDFGLQTAIGRYVAFASEKGDATWRDGIFSTAFAALAVASFLGILVVVIVLLAVHRIFPSVPPAFVAPMRICMMIVGISTALGLPASAWNGVFVGLQRYEVVAITVGAGKLLTAAGLAISAFTGKSLFFMAMTVAAANLITYIAQFVMMRSLAPEVKFRRELITRKMAGELWGYCASLSVWSFAMLLVSGVDILLVGRFQFNAVTPYSVSATLVAFIAGVQNAIFGVIMPHAAGLSAREDSASLGGLLIAATRVGTLLLLLTGLPLIVFAAPLIKLWIGSQFASEGGKILIVLIVANVVRLTGAPYASILLGTGQQKLIVVSPLMEGVSNFIASILLGMKFGAIGVAEGTLIGAFVGVGANVFYNVARTKECISVSRWDYLRSIAVPGLCAAPVCCALLSQKYIRPSGYAVAALMLALSCCLCMAGIFRSVAGRSASDVSARLRRAVRGEA
jgi:O-antigen/teichoic acid export membrane protein